MTGYRGRPPKMRASDLGLEEPTPLPRVRDYVKEYTYAKTHTYERGLNGPEMFEGDDGYHSIGWKGLVHDGEPDGAGLAVHPLHCELPRFEENWYDNSGAAYREQRAYAGISRTRLRHVDRWFAFDKSVPLRFLGFDNRGRRAKAGVDNDNGLAS